MVRTLGGGPVCLTCGALLALDDAVQFVGESLLFLLQAGAKEHVGEHAAESEADNERGENGN